MNSLHCCLQSDLAIKPYNLSQKKNTKYFGKVMRIMLIFKDLFIFFVVLTVLLLAK